MQKANIPEHHWAMPHPLWKQQEAEKKGKVVTQGTLDGSLIGMSAPEAPLVFTHKNLLHAVTQFIAVDDQVRPVKRNNINDTQVISLLVPRHCK